MKIVIKWLLIFYFTANFLSAENSNGKSVYSLKSVHLAPKSTLTDFSHWGEHYFRQYLKEGGTVERKVQIVVPVYCELKNGNLIRLMDSLLNQSVIRGENYELLILVNNTKQVALEKNHPAYLENQQTLQMLEYIKGTSEQKDFFKGLAPSQVEMIKKLVDQLRKTKMGLRVIDKSTEGLEKINIGSIRNTGVQELVREYKNSGIDTIIAMMDADVLCPQDYIENLLVQFHIHQAQSLFINVRYQLWEALHSRHFKKTYSGRYPYFWIYFSESLKGRSPFLGSPQIIANASMFETINGVPAWPRGEDVILASMLMNKPGNVRDTQTEVLVSDRAKSDGFGASDTRFKNLKEDKPVVFHEPLLFFLSHAFNICFQQGDYRLDNILSYFTTGFSVDELNTWRAYSKQEKLLRDQNDAPEYYNDALFRKPLQEMPTYTFFKKKLPEKEFAYLKQSLESEIRKHETARQALIQNAKKIHNRWLSKLPLVSPQDAIEFQEFFRINPWLEKEIRETLAALPSEKINNFDFIQVFLEKEYPDYFAAFEKAYDKQQIIFLSILNNFFTEVETHPESYPVSHPIVQAFHLFFENSPLSHKSLSLISQSL